MSDAACDFIGVALGALGWAAIMDAPLWLPAVLLVGWIAGRVSKERS